MGICHSQAAHPSRPGTTRTRVQIGGGEAGRRTHNVADRRTADEDWDHLSKVSLEEYLNLSLPNCARTGDLVQFYSTPTSMWLEQKDGFAPGDLIYSGIMYIMQDSFHSGTIIVRDGKVYLLHSTGGKGVHMILASEEVRKRHQKGQMIQIRRLRHPEQGTPEFIQKVQSFTDRVVGLPYKHVSYASLVKNIMVKNVSQKVQDTMKGIFVNLDPLEDIGNALQDRFLNPREGFYCSQLVGTFYRHLGYLPEQQFHHLMDDFSDEVVEVMPRALDTLPANLPGGATLSSNIILGDRHRTLRKDVHPGMQLLLSQFREMRKQEWAGMEM